MKLIQSTLFSFMNILSSYSVKIGERDEYVTYEDPHVKVELNTDSIFNSKREVEIYLSKDQFTSQVQSLDETLAAKIMKRIEAYLTLRNYVVIWDNA